MSYLLAAPEFLASTATDLAGIASALSAAHAAAAAPTVALAPAAVDEVSGSISHLFSGYAQAFQGLAGKAAAFHDQFVQTLRTSAHSYAGAEAAAAVSLQHSVSSASTMPGLLADVAALLVPLHNWFLTWPAGIQGFVNEISLALTAVAVAAFVVLFVVLVPLVVLLAPLGL
jgi:hypothetical protein